MSLESALKRIVEEYPRAKSKGFAGNSLATFIRVEVPATLKELVGNDQRYTCDASPGKGNWARSPWAAVYDRLITESAQDGYYVVYLFKEDFSGIYISLNQGVTAVKSQYGSAAKSALKVRAADFLARLGSAASGLDHGPIDLFSNASGTLSASYEAASICSKFYPAANIPDDAVLSSDLRRFIDLYFLLVSRDSSLYTRADLEDDEEGLDKEDLTRLREHKRIERNKSLARKVKKAQGFVCKACGFDFEKKYGEIGKDFIEAHHLTPLHSLKGQVIALSPTKDFSVLCSNCHRMIHKTEFIDSVKEFRATYVVNVDA